MDRIPVDLWHTPEILAALKDHFSLEDDLQLYKAMKLDKIVWVFLDYKGLTENESFAAQDGALVMQLANAFGGIEYLRRPFREFIENWEVESYRSKQL